MRISNQNTNNPNFTSVVRFKVVIDNLHALDEKSINRALRDFQDKLIHPAEGNEAIIKMKRFFSSHINDFNYHGEKVDIGEVLRHVVVDKKGFGYIFTGIHAKNLNELGKKIGVKKHQALEILGVVKSYESSCAVKNYFNKARDYISYPSCRVKENINEKTMNYIGDEIGLVINAKSIGRPDKKGYKVVAGSIDFVKIPKNGTVSESVSVKESVTLLKPVQSNVKKFKDRYKKSKTNAVQGSLFA